MLNVLYIIIQFEINAHKGVSIGYWVLTPASGKMEDMNLSLYICLYHLGFGMVSLLLLKL